MKRSVSQGLRNPKSWIKQKRNISLPSWRCRLQITVQFYGYYIVLCVSPPLIFFDICWHLPSLYHSYKGHKCFMSSFDKGMMLKLLFRWSVFVGNTSTWFSRNLLKCNYCTPFIQNKEEAQGLSFTCFPPKSKFVRSELAWARTQF